MTVTHRCVYGDNTSHYSKVNCDLCLILLK